MSERIDPKVLANLVEPQDVYLSPDGKKVVYMVCPLDVRKSENMQSSLWIAEVGKEYSARQIVSDEFHNYAPTFSPTGTHIAFLSDRASPGKAVCLHLLPLDGGEAYPLTAKDNEMGVGAYRWTSDGRSIAFISADEKSEDKKQKEHDKDDANVYDEDVAYGRLRIISVNTKEVKSLRSVEGNGTQLAWNPQNTKIAYTTSKSPLIEDVSTGTDLYIVDPSSDTAQKLCHYPGSISDLCWQENKLLWCGGNIAVSTCVYELCPEDADPSFKVIHSGKTDCAAGIKQYTNRIVVQVHRGLTDILETLEGEELYQEKRFVSNWHAHFGESQHTLVLSQGSVGRPVEVYSIANGSRVQLSQHGETFGDRDIGTAHSCEYTHEDGTPIDGVYAVPAALKSAFEQRKAQPTVLVVRGGPYGRVNDRFDFGFNWTTFFMSLGYLVLCPNYRGGSSHGNDYAEAVRENAAASYQDVIWLVKKGIAEGRIDGDRVAITGWSQGGYLSYLAVTRDDTFHFRASVPGAGVSDWTSMPLTSDLPSYESQLSGPAAWAVKDIHDITSRKCSPIFHMQNIKTPVLILHGEDDQRVPLEQAVGFYRGMKARNQDVTMITFPREGHSYPVPFEQKHYIFMLEYLEKFLAKHMA